MDDLFFHVQFRAPLEARCPSFDCLLVTQRMSFVRPSPTPRPRRRPLGILSCTAKRRWSHNNINVNKISCSDNDSSSVDLKIVSTTECSDGGVLFRFGNVSEIERYKQAAEEEGSATHGKFDKFEVLEKESSRVVKFHSTRGKRSDPVAMGVHRQDHISESERLLEDNVLEVKTRVHSEQVSNDEVREDSQAAEFQIDIEPPTPNTSIESRNIQVSVAAKADKHHVTVPVPAFTQGNTIEADPITYNTLDEFVDKHTTASSETLDGFLPSLIHEEEKTNFDTPSSETAEVSVSYSEESHSMGTTLKREEMSRTGLSFASGACSLANPFQALTSRGDAYFVACHNWLGVGDGIGLWSFEGIKIAQLGWKIIKGIRAGLHAQELMQNCKKIVSESKNFPVTDPIEILKRSAAETKSPGSSCVLVAYFDGQALHVANIGDSGFIIIRNGTVIERSSSKVHEINFPIQIQSGDDPSEFVEGYKIDLDEGDVIITATDGLFDNLYEQEIVSVVSRSLQDGLKPQEIAESLAVRAQEAGKLGSVRCPFADAAQAAGYVGYRGAKLDDVTVIVSLVERRSNTPL